MTQSFSHRRKLDRAERHIQDVKAMLVCWARDGYRIFEKPDSERNLVLYAEQLKPLPDQLPLAIGDAFHCERASLDQLIYALSKKHSPKMTAKDEDDPAFPIYDGAVSLTNRRIKHLNAKARKDVCALAPDPARQPLHNDPLWLLNKMENRDKHREIPVTVTAAQTRGAAVNTAKYFRLFGPQRLQDGAGPMAILVYTPTPDFDAEVRLSVEVLFDQGLEVANREVLSVLREFYDHIRDTVFQRLETHL